MNNLCFRKQSFLLKKYCDRFLYTRFWKKNLLKIMLTIVNEGSSFTNVIKGLLLMIVNETTNFIKTVVELYSGL